MKKGFTLIELLAVIVILAAIALITTPVILSIIDNAKKEAFKNTAYGISHAAENAFIKNMYSGETPKNITYTYTNSTESSNPNGYSLNYSGAKPKEGRVQLNTQGKISLTLYDGKYCATKGVNDAEVTVVEKTKDECLPPLVDQSGANAPVLATGMRAVIWDSASNTWVDASNPEDPYTQNWYNYGTSAKKWANATTTDGSLWVWVPRYAYQIATNYHVAAGTGGTINIKFLSGDTNNPADGSATVATVPTYSSNQTNYIKHPGFTFGTDEVTGMWIAKFEASVANQSDLCYTSPSTANCSKTTLTPKFIPGAKSWRSISISNIYTTTLNMENNTAFGLTANNVDTHMMKNSEWGVVAYLSQSTYGINSIITKNASSSFYTGSGTGNTYASNVNQSTTGTIYGIYDMSGGSLEYVMGNYNNLENYSGLTPNSIDDKYIDRYNATNNGYDSSKYGDAIFETSYDARMILLDLGNETGSWYGNTSIMMDSDHAWFTRGGFYNNSSNLCGLFYFNRGYGSADSQTSFRAVIITD